MQIFRDVRMLNSSKIMEQPVIVTQEFCFGNVFHGALPHREPDLYSLGGVVGDGNGARLPTFALADGYHPLFLFIVFQLKVQDLVDATGTIQKEKDYRIVPISIEGAAGGRVETASRMFLHVPEVAHGGDEFLHIFFCRHIFVGSGSVTHFVAGEQTRFHVVVFLTPSEEGFGTNGIVMEGKLGKSRLRAEDKVGVHLPLAKFL